MKAVIVVDFAYKSPKQSRRGAGHQSLKAVLKYLQYRDPFNNQLARTHAYERWHDRGLGRHYRDIHTQCDQLQSQHVLAWTWVISPDPDLMTLVPEKQRRQLLCDVTECVVEDYYTARGFDVPEYSYVLHRRITDSKNGSPIQEHLHTHVVLPGTAPSAAERLSVYNNREDGHDALFREIATRHFAAALDRTLDLDWRLLRDGQELPPAQTPLYGVNDLDIGSMG